VYYYCIKFNILVSMQLSCQKFLSFQCSYSVKLCFKASFVVIMYTSRSQLNKYSVTKYDIDNHNFLLKLKTGFNIVEVKNLQFNFNFSTMSQMNMVK
jgi:hypothetical protein